MRKPLTIVGVALASLFLGHTVAQACGDKLLAFGRGVNYQRAYHAARPAAILLYLGQNAKGGALEEPKLQSALKDFGHTLRVVADAGQLEQVLKSGRFDLVLGDVSEFATLSQHAKSSPSRPIVMPVLYKPTKQSRAAAEKQYGPVLSAPGKAGEYFMAIEEVMKRRGKSSV